jgi:DNA-binding transcriptional ArsR family regulator
MADRFAALAHPTRREILRLLRGGPLSAGDLARHFDLAKPTLSGHFNVLKAAELISAERRGTTLLYRLNLSVVEEAISALMELAGTGRKRRKP